MESFSVTTTLTREDWAELSHATRMRAAAHARRMSPLLRWLPLIAWVLVFGTMLLLADLWPEQFPLESMAVGFALAFGLGIFVAAKHKQLLVPAEDGAFFGRVEYHVGPQGIDTLRARSRGHSAWASVREISHTPAYVFVWIDHFSAHVLRAADLPASMTVDEAVARMRAFKSAAGEGAPVAAEPGTDGSPVAAPAMAGVGHVDEVRPPTMWQELKALWRLETLREVEPRNLYGRDATIFLLAALSVGLCIGLDRLNFGSDAEFMWYGVGGIGLCALIGMVLAWTLSRLSRPRLPLRRSLLLVAFASPLVVLAGWVLPGFGRPMYVLTLVVLLGWVSLLVHSGLRAMTGTRQARALAVGLAGLGLAFYLSSWFMPAGASVWYAPDPDYDPSAASIGEQEQLKFEQAPRIDATVAKMPAGDAAKPAMYFVGFAGYGDQRVFAEEIGTAARVADEKFATGDRELRLVNDRRDDRTWPLASVSALRHGLLSLGRRMDVENDVLFLALSSHGGEDATLSVVNDSMDYWRDLDAPSLRAMLDESGIRWRVIVISACHAGSFIESLADERTIVLTAAAKENTSFGCSDDRDLTYFGEAFYRDALPKAASLREAFEQARAAIAIREKDEGVDESDPQAHFGALLEAKLAQMAAAAAPVSARAQGR
jgi:hypothetical protein